MRILITAGGTREYIDPVRFITNASSGRMGYALARAALRAGHKVTLITTVEKPNIKYQKAKLRMVAVETATEMFRAVKKHFPRCDCLIMAAAVADYTPVRTAKAKIKKQDKSLTLRLRPTPDILQWAGKHKSEPRLSRVRPKDGSREATPVPSPAEGRIEGSHACPESGRRTDRGKSRIVVGFALEDKNLRANAERKMREKNLDMIVANTPAAIGAGKTGVHIKIPGQKWLRLAQVTKAAVARKIVSLATAIQTRSYWDLSIETQTQ